MAGVGAATTVHRRQYQSRQKFLNGRQVLPKRCGKPRSRADWAECGDPGRYRLRAIGLDLTRDLLPGQWRCQSGRRYRAASNGWTHLVGDGERRVRNCTPSAFTAFR